MINDVEFIRGSINNGLYYLRSIREYCATIQLSFFGVNEEYIKTAEMFALKCEELGKPLIEYANGNVSQESLDTDIFVTPYTLPLEKLTEKLFGININTELTEQELKLKSGVIVPTQELISNLEKINAQATVLVTNFIEFCREIFAGQEKREIFLYLWPCLILLIMEDCKTYKNILERLKTRSSADPTFVATYEYNFNKFLRDIALFLRNFACPSNEDIFIKLQSFVSEFNYLLEEYKALPMSPSNQEKLTAKSKDLVQRFSSYVEELIKMVLDEKIYFTVAPIALDNMYTSVNFFKYILFRSESEKGVVE